MLEDSSIHEIEQLKYYSGLHIFTQMVKGNRSLLYNCFRSLLRPIVRYALRHGLSIQEFTEILKSLYVNEAIQQVLGRGEKPNISRLSVVTGLRRREVQRLSDEKEVMPESLSVPARAIGRWKTDKRFLTNSGQPRTLSLNPENPEFEHLVRSITKDIGYKVVLKDLERISAVKISSKGVKLLSYAYNPRGDAQEGFNMLSHDINDLIHSVEENVADNTSQPNLHATTEYTNITEKSIQKLRTWLIKEGMSFHQRAVSYFSSLDKDTNPKAKGKSGVRVVLGTFSRIQKKKKGDKA